MPNQTTGRGFVYFPDGAKWSVKPQGDTQFFDVGCINSAVNNVLNYDENQVQTSNCGDTEKQIKNMSMAGDLTLIDLDPLGVQKISGGMLELVTTTGTPTTDVDDQVLAADSVTDKTAVNLVLNDDTNNLGSFKAAAEPTITSITGSTDGALVANDDYTIVPDVNSRSGYSVIFNLAGAALTTYSQTLTIDYGSTTPIESTVVYGGSTTEILAPMEVKITHTDDAGKIRQLDLFRVDINSGALAFNFKGANEDGVEELPFSYTARVNTSLTNKRQLFAWTIESGAE